MSSKTNKTLNSSLGIPAYDGVVVVPFTTATTLVSGLLYGDAVYRFDTTEDCSFYLGQLSPGAAAAAGVNKIQRPTLFSGVPEIFSTSAGVTTEGPCAKSIHIVASGIDSSGYLHCTLMKTRGE